MISSLQVYVLNHLYSDENVQNNSVFISMNKKEHNLIEIAVIHLDYMSLDKNGKQMYLFFNLM